MNTRGGVQTRARRLPSPINTLSSIIIFVTGATLGAYLTSVGQRGVQYEVVGNLRSKDPQASYRNLNREDFECSARIEAAEWARDRQWEDIVTLQRQEITRLTQELSLLEAPSSPHLKGGAPSRAPLSAAQANVDARLAALHGERNLSSVASQMQRLSSETGFKLHGLLDAESLRETFFANMVPFTHAKRALLLSDHLKQRPKQWPPATMLDLLPPQTLDQCKELSVIMTGPQTCYALLPAQTIRPSLTVYRFQKGAATQDWEPMPKAKVESKQNPTHNQRLTHERVLRRLFTNLESVEALLGPVLSDAAAAHRAHYPRHLSDNWPNKKDERKVVKVMILNHGNLGVFLNFMCSVHKAAQGEAFGDLVIFTADAKADEVLTRLGYRTFRHASFGDLPANEHTAYGDMTFLTIMWLKSLSGWLVNRLGYDFLYLDSDMYFVQDPTPLFLVQPPAIDVIMQDDGARTDRFSPYYGNTGLFFVKCNDKTRHFMQSVLFSWDLMLSWKSHQSVFTTLLQDHYLRNTLGVKILPLDLLPTGKVFHHQKAKLSAIVNGTMDFYMFHMNWALHNTAKTEHFRSIGWWLVSDHCTQNRSLALDDSSIRSIDQCCTFTQLPTMPDAGAAQMQASI